MCNYQVLKRNPKICFSLDKNSLIQKGFHMTCVGAVIGGVSSGSGSVGSSFISHKFKKLYKKLPQDISPQLQKGEKY